jgi:hypothetical protein
MGFAPTIYLVQLPLYTLLMFLFFNAWALFAGLVSAIGKDFSNLVKSFNIAVFWLSGILWNVENVADNKIHTFLYSTYRNYAYTFFNLVPTITAAVGVSALPVLTMAWTNNDKSADVIPESYMSHG